MAFNLRNRSFLKEIDFEPGELRFLLALSESLKMAKYAGNEVKRLEGKEVALIFEKTSTRTRAAFEVAAFDQGAHVTYLDPTGSQLGHKESVADTARVLGRMYDAIEFRGNAQADVEELAAYAGVPVYNGLTNEWHPTQMLEMEADGSLVWRATVAGTIEIRLWILSWGSDVEVLEPAALRDDVRRTLATALRAYE